MTTLVMPRFRHEGVLSDGNGIFGDESDLSQKLFSLVVHANDSGGSMWFMERTHMH